ncbi:MAG: ANTAR domain-containing protein, partial [Clostridia bacterium]|nr:ANTAR domain-containing protein [Clostridia bacterium]
LDWLKATRERLRNMETKNLSLQEKMEEIKLINRAKWTLINSLGMTEIDAHRYIEKQAMDRCVTRREIAENIIQTYK